MMAKLVNYVVCNTFKPAFRRPLVDRIGNRNLYILENPYIMSRKICTVASGNRNLHKGGGFLQYTELMRQLWTYLLYSYGLKGFLGSLKKYQHFYVYNVSVFPNFISLAPTLYYILWSI